MERPGFRKTDLLVMGIAALVMIVAMVGAAAVGGLPPNTRSDQAGTHAQSSAPAPRAPVMTCPCSPHATAHARRAARLSRSVQWKSK
jgi:hypothetical protein